MKGEERMSVSHGTTRGYRQGCRCDLCKAAKKRDAAGYSARKKAGIPSRPPGRPAIPLSERAHGDYVTYSKGCRCQPCSEANSRYGRERKLIRRGETERPEVAQLRQLADDLGYRIRKKRGNA